MIKPNITTAQVFKREISSSGSEKTTLICEGIITDFCTDKGGNPSFVKIYNPKVSQKDAARGLHQCADWFAMNSKFINVKIIGEIKKYG